MSDPTLQIKVEQKLPRLFEARVYALGEPVIGLSEFAVTAASALDQLADRLQGLSNEALMLKNRATAGDLEVIQS